MTFTIELEGHPIAKMRHRSAIRHGHIASYDPQDEAKKTVRFLMGNKLRMAVNSNDKKIQMQASSLVFCSCFHLEMDFLFATPTTMSKRDASLALWMGHHNGKPDIDNLAKFYLDAANGILWNDDSQVVSLKARKKFSLHPRTVIKITGTKPMSLNEKAEGILGLFSPDRYHEMVQDIVSDFSVDGAGEENNPQVQRSHAERAAIILSRIADKYAQDLSKITKRYPGYWQGQTDISQKSKKENTTC